jgi:serine phosphatase RsbU (regulator of sigma subunit)
MRRDTIFQILITTILFTLASLHFVFYLFYPRFRENLFYAISTIGIGGIWYANNQMNFLVSQNRILAINILSTGSQIIAVFFGLLLTYWFRYEKIPLRASVYALFGCVILLWSTIRLNAEFYIAKDLYTFIAFAEMVFSLIRAKNKDKVGAYIISTGFIILTVSVFYEILAGNRWIPRIEGARDTYVLGALALGISMSIFLSRRFAKTHRELELQLKQVRELSERTLAQERQAREVEIERRLLEADNSRKTKELEEARALQLSMLPRVLPMIPNLDIAVYMKTAAEVGGDYYDFAVAPDGTLTIVLGDATGHGTKAGMMVAITKSLFDDYTHTQNIPDIFNKYTNSIKKLELHSLYMALLLVRIKDGKLVASSAGIPSPLIYRFISREVEELILKGMPLGSFQNFPYEQRETQLSIGDTVVLMSDGLSERFNGKKEGFGVTAVKELLSKIGNTSSQEIIHHLSAASESWASGEPQNDDIMMVVVKLKSI